MTNTVSSMERIATPGALRDRLRERRTGGRGIALVPTMGALHEGHLSLIDRARAAADTVVLSVFVNPLQFGPTEDFARYPRNLDADSSLAEDRGVDFLFMPSVETMYAARPRVSVVSGEAGKQWEGAVRPGHFSGVLTVVAKLFNIVAPDVAVFGQKDLQQSALVRALVEDLNFPIELIVAPIVRESDGLAMSSRNQYLAEGDRMTARSLNAALTAAAHAFAGGTTDARALERTGRNALDSDVTAVDYFSVVNQDTFAAPDTARSGDAIIVAAVVGNTRLIDNVIL